MNDEEIASGEIPEEITFGEISEEIAPGEIPCVEVSSEEIPFGELAVRPMRGEDAGRVAEMCGQLGYPSTGEDILRRHEALSGDSHHEFSVVENPAREVIAWVHLHLCMPMVSEKRAEIWGLVVDEAWRGRGVGSGLMAYAETWAGARGCGSIWLRSNVIRDGAHAFYEQLGYETVKTQRVFRKELKPTT